MYATDKRIALGCSDRIVRVVNDKDFSILGEFEGNTKKIRKL